MLYFSNTYKQQIKDREQKHCQDHICIIKCAISYNKKILNKYMYNRILYDGGDSDMTNGHGTLKKK